MVQARTIALANSSNLNILMLQLLSLVKFPHDPAVRRVSDRSTRSATIQRRLREFFASLLRSLAIPRDVPVLLGIEMLDHKSTQILIYEIHPDLQL
jgi:hypothetical protein